MANVLIHRIEFLQNNPFGEFVTGDILEVYLDESLLTPTGSVFEGISVNKNGVTASSGAFITFDPNIVSLQSYNYQICFGTSLTVIDTSALFPYGSHYPLENHYSCVVNPPTCDLIVVGSPEVTPATGEDNADGVITINAESTNTIEYKLGADFIYGEGQISGTFTDLLPGDYRIYLRDSANCAANILATVIVNNTYGTVFQLEYDGVHGYTSKIEITKRGYSSGVSEICGQSIPFEIQLRGEGETDKFKAVLSSQANLNLTSESDGFFSTLYTNNPNLYRVNFSKNFGSGYEQLWTGKILPFIYSEQVKSPPYEVTVVASDGLPELKDFYLIQKDGQKFFGKDKLIKIVAYCLRQIGLDLSIRVACNMYATGMVSTDSDDPFDQAYIDYDCFYLAKNKPDLLFVLGSILEPFNARIIQWENVWNIVRVEELSAAYDYREFDSNGDYVSNSTFNPVKEVDYPATNGIMWEAFPNLELVKGFGQIKVFYKLGLKPNIIYNGDFRLKSIYNAETNRYDFTVNTDGFTLVNASYPITTGYEELEEGNIAYYISGGDPMITNSSSGNAYLQTSAVTLKMAVNNQVKINLRYKIPKTSVTLNGEVYSIDAPYIKLRVRVKYGNYYLQNDGSWTATDNTLIFFVTQLSEYVESEIIANYPILDGVPLGTPQSGMSFDIRVYHSYVYYAQFQSVTSLENFVTYTGGDQIIPTGYKTELRDSFAAVSYVYYYELEETTETLGSGYTRIKPADWHISNNPRMWIIQKKINTLAFLTGQNLFSLYLDRIKATYLIAGKEVYDTVIRIANAEPLNKDTFEKELIIGSYSSLITTEVIFNLDQSGIFFPNPAPGLTLVTNNIVSADLVYAGWLRDSSGVGYEFWARDGVSESDKLHAIWLKNYSSEYFRSWRMVRGSTVSRTEYFGLLNVLKDVNDNDRIYIPISLTLDDLNNRASGEYLELISGVDGSDNSGASPFTSGFSTGFGSSGFN